MTEKPTAGDQVFADVETLAQHAAEWLCRLATSNDGRFAICCSGGSTPKRLYEVLAEPAVASQFPWGRVHWFWGDERFVPHNHPDSNYGMMYNALFSHAPIPDSNIHTIPTDNLTPEQAAAIYETTLKEFYGASKLHADRPLFDVTLLGLGEDGHTASLFPGHAALDERDRWVLAVIGVMPEARITLTYPILNSCAAAAFLIAGEEKRAVAARAQAADRTIPAGRIHPSGPLHWFIDRAAAS